MIKNIIYTLIVIIFSSQNIVQAETDWDELYHQSEPCPVKLMHNLDPFQDEDNVKYSYSPYPLLRTSCYLYYKRITIPSGYYQLTPRKISGKYYIFFKTSGRVAYIIPVVKRELVPSAFYKKYVLEAKVTRGQAFKRSWIRFWQNIFKGSGKQSPPKSYLELQNLQTYYILKLYYDNHSYISVFKKVPY